VKRRKRTLLFIILFLLLGIAAVHVLGLIYTLYWQLWWYDILLHLAGGFWVGFLFFYIFGERLNVFSETQVMARPFVMLVLAIGFVLLVGVLWEFYEYMHDIILASRYTELARQPNLGDTLSDLVNDIIGGAGG